MFRPLSLYIGLRYTRAKRRNHFISFVSLVSMLGIALGVMAIITSLSVTNGFDYQIRNQFFAIAPEVTIMTGHDITKLWPNLRNRVNKIPQVIDSAPYISGQGMLSNQGVISGVQVVGILPEQENKISQLATKFVAGSLSSLTSGSYNMVIGQKLADRLGLVLGSKVILFTPQATTTPVGVFPQLRRFTISGIFATKSGFGFDTGVAYINLQDAHRLFPGSQGIGGLHIKIQSIYQAQAVSDQIQSMLPNGYLVTNWTEQYGAFFHGVAMEKTVAFFITILIVLVAVFNLVSSLVMAVNDKRADIAILRTLGASPRTIMTIFIIQGGILGIVGTIFGVVAGIILSLSVTDITNWVQHLFGVQFIKASVYFVDFLPSRLQWSDVINISIIAVVLSLLATIYPAILAFRTQPAEALRYE